MRKYIYVVNPRAGRGVGQKVGEQVSRILSRDNSDSDLVYTKEPGDARKIASESDAHVVVAVGGDGTVNEVLNGIGDSDKVLGIIPAGSGNDSVKSLGIPIGVEEALRTIRGNVLRRVDTAFLERPVQTTGLVRTERHLFLNGAGIGFDASVARRVASIRRLRGTLLYLVAVLTTIREYVSPEVEVRVDGRSVLKGKKLLVAIGNGACAGGGFYLTPHAEVDDGLLDLCSIPDMTAIGILKIVPRVLRGTHVSIPGIDYIQGTSVTVTSSTGFPLHADGEIMGEELRDVRFQLRPASLSVLVPEAGRAL